MSGYDDSGAIKLTMTERVATSMKLMAYARLSMLCFGIMGTIGVPVAGFVGIRFVNAWDKMNEQQMQTREHLLSLQAEVRHTVSDMVTSQKNVRDEMERSDRVLNDRINTQGTWMQQLSSKVEDLSKYVYTKVR